MLPVDPGVYSSVCQTICPLNTFVIVKNLKIDVVRVESNWVHSVLRPLIGLLC
jgi:hypothetical protein